MRHVVAPTEDGIISTTDIEQARDAVAAAGFFETAFGTDRGDQAAVHDEVMSKLLDEVHGWRDQPTDETAPGS